MTLLIGSDGSMGRRYQAILNHLGEPFAKLDVHNINSIAPAKYEHFDRFIIATPTDTHFRWVMNLDYIGKPILCEKPLSTDWDETRRILDCKSPLSMMMQYALFDSKDNVGPSYYNYFNHGKDGLKWDCFQIVALARGDISIKESSPVWQCKLNGRELDISQMDRAYIGAVQQFLDGRFIPKDVLSAWHKKVNAYV